MKIKSVFAGIAMLFLLAGCAEGPPDTQPPEMTFANFQPVELNVARIEVRNDYQPPMRDPNVEHTFQTPPYVAAENLVKKQLVASGMQNILRVIVADAPVIREELPTIKGVMDSIEREPAELLKARVLLRFELVDERAPDIVIGRAQVIAKREKTLLEDTSLTDRDRAYFDLTEALMTDLNNGLTTSVKNAFGRKTF